MNNFELFFKLKFNKGFSKNFEIWKNECEDYSKFTGNKSAEEVYLFYNPDSNICQHPDCNSKTRFITIVRGFDETCCRVHSMELTSLRKYGVRYKSQSPEFRDAVKNTVREKYGCDNVFASNEIKEKIKETNLEKYGYETATKNVEVKEKTKRTTLEKHGGYGFQTGRAKETLMKKYGVDNPSQIAEFQEKKKRTFIEKFGVDNPMKNKDVQEKGKETSLERYGVENIFEDSDYIQSKFKEKYGVSYPLQVKEIQEKVSKTHKEKYSDNHWMHNPEVLELRQKTYQEKFGADHPMQTIDVFERNLNSAYRRKEYIWKTGEISYLQGYEPFVLKELEEKGYLFEDVKTLHKDMPEIWYFYEGKRRRYYPDFYIPKENMIIEVKSNFTIKDSTNELKFAAVKELGFEFRLEIR